MRRKTISVPAPLAVEGDRVLALNYRRKSVVAWEPGTVTDVRFELLPVLKASFWRYQVRLDRRSPNDHPVRLCLNDDGIRLEE